MTMNTISESRDPLFPATAFFPLSQAAGGVQFHIANEPGPLRPFSATLGRVRPLDGKKHDTTATRDTHATPQRTNVDNHEVDDTITDTDTDS